MSLTPYPVPTFGGLNLVDDPEEVGANGAIDLLNVDVDRRGRLRSRDGYDNFTSSAAAARLASLASFYMIDGTKHVVTNHDQSYTAYTAAGAVAGTVNHGTVINDVDYTRFGGLAAEVIYAAGFRVASGTPFSLYKWTGAAWAAGGAGLGGFSPYLIEVQSTDNRLVGAFQNSNFSRVGFSDPGTPETFTATSFVDLTPGDGEKITALIGWREFVFAFKESKYFVFTGNSTGATGLPIFNYRPVAAGVGAVARGAAVGTPTGVYFFDRRGIYRTTGGDPVLISRAIDPIFRGNANATFLGGVLNHTARAAVRMTWHDERLYVAYPSGSSTTNDRLLVYDPETGTWVLWAIPAATMTSFRVGDQAELLFTYASGSNHIGRVNSTYITDDGTAIASRYQSGFYEPSPSAETTTRWTKLWGSGSPTLDIFTNHATSDPLSRGGTVTLGTAPAVAKGYHLKSYQGELFSHKLSSTSGVWAVNRLEHDMQFAFQPS